MCWRTPPNPPRWDPSTATPVQWASRWASRWATRLVPRSPPTSPPTCLPLLGCTVPFTAPCRFSITHLPFLLDRWGFCDLLWRHCDWTARGKNIYPRLQSHSHAQSYSHAHTLALTQTHSNTYTFAHSHAHTLGATTPRPKRLSGPFIFPFRFLLLYSLKTNIVSMVPLHQ